MAKTKEHVIAQLTEIAGVHDNAGNTNTANDIRSLITELNDNQKDHSQIKINATVQIAKYDGNMLPNSVPVETTEFISDL